MIARKWRLVEGHVFKLSRTFDNCIDALDHARIMNRKHHAVLLKVGDDEWAVYWRPKDEVQCESKHYSVEDSSSENPSQMNS